jgi:alpha-L-fucosidase
MSESIAHQQLDTEQRENWFVHDRFGLFIHWGIFAAAARHEWVKSREKLSDETYQAYFDHFDPDLYDPKEWARLAKQAGMRYAVITTKHHDGFCLWDSQLTDYNATKTPAGRDLIRLWVDAFRSEGLKIGFYHSLIDWHHPHFPLDGYHPQRDDPEARKRAANRDMRLYVDYLHGQVRELLMGYGTIDILWFDFSYARSDWGWAKGKGKDDWQSERLVRLVRDLQPHILINDRAEVDMDFYTPEQVQPHEWFKVDGRPVTWEECQTLNGSWGYDRDNHDWKSPELLIHMLIDSVSKGGNLLLNVGPTARGEFDPYAQTTLRSLGDWMRHHGQSIYGATASEYPAPTDCRFTQSGQHLYLHIFTWPFQSILLPQLAGKIAYAQLLNDGSEIRLLEDADTFGLVLPVQRPDVLVPVIELFLKDA